MPRKYKKRTYKKKKYYKRKTYKRRYYKRSYKKSLKKPEIHILENQGFYNDNGTIKYEVPFNAPNGASMGLFKNLNEVVSVNSSYSDIDSVQYCLLNGNNLKKSIEGSKIRLKYLYIKGYIKVASSEDADDFNCKLMVFRWKRNPTNSDISWTHLMNGVSSSTPSSWTEEDRLNMMYKQDWKNDLKINFSKKVKNLYRKYDDANNIIPFKIRVPLYDCVMTCESRLLSGSYQVYPNASTNGLYFTYLSNKYDANTIISYKYKLYYTDY